MYHPASWGSWAFEVSDFTQSSGTMNFAKGGFQEGRGSSGVGKLYIENLMEELDTGMEYFLDSGTNTLFYVPASIANFLIDAVE